MKIIINGPKTLLCSTPDTTKISLLRQLSTITWCDRFDRNSVSIDNTAHPIPTEHSIKKIHDGWYYHRLCRCYVVLHNPSLLPTLQFTLQWIGHTQKCITGTQTFPISKLVGGKHTAAFNKSSKTNRHRNIDRRNSMDSTGDTPVVSMSAAVTATDSAVAKFNGQ